MPRWFIRTGCGEQADLAGGDRASAVGSRSGRSTSFESAWPRPRSRHKLLDPVPRMRGSIHDWPARRVETARSSLKHMRRFRLAPRGGQNGARPGFRAIQHGECALGSLEGRFCLPGRCVRIGGRAPAQGVHPSAMEVLGARNGQLPLRSRCLPPPSQNPMCRDRSAREPRLLGESGRACREARASPTCTNPRGRRFRHFGGRC